MQQSYCPDIFVVYFGRLVHVFAAQMLNVLTYQHPFLEEKPFILSHLRLKR